MSLTRSYPMTHEHIQAVASDTWTVIHNLKMYPIIDVFVEVDGNVHKIIPAGVEYTDMNSCVVTFSSPQVGHAMVC